MHVKIVIFGSTVNWWGEDKFTILIKWQYLHENFVCRKIKCLFIRKDNEVFMSVIMCFDIHTYIWHLIRTIKVKYSLWWIQRAKYSEWVNYEIKFNKGKTRRVELLTRSEREWWFSGAMMSPKVSSAIQ